MIVRRVEALGRFLETEDGATLLALVRRALNILKIEEKKDARATTARLLPNSLKRRKKRRSTPRSAPSERRLQRPFNRRISREPWRRSPSSARRSTPSSTR